MKWHRRPLPWCYQNQSQPHCDGLPRFDERPDRLGGDFGALALALAPTNLNPASFGPLAIFGSCSFRFWPAKAQVLRLTRIWEITVSVSQRSAANGMRPWTAIPSQIDGVRSGMVMPPRRRNQFEVPGFGVTS
jgi:hypothetical protein